MPREHQREKNNPYLLPHNLYMRVLYIIRDYARVKEEYHAILQSSPAPRITSGYDARGRYVSEMMPGSGGVSDPTMEKAMRLAVISSELHAVEQALLMVKAEYRDGVMANITEGAHFPKGAGVSTYRRWKQRYAYYVAKKLKFI